MFPSTSDGAHPATELWQVERDANPLRRFGHVSPFISKLGPLNSQALDVIGQLARSALPSLPEPTLVIGMTESSLLLAFFMALWQEKPVDLRFTTRYNREGESKIAFREPHSHGPQHYLALEPGRRYAQIVIIEDELTTGATLRNLILAVADISQRVFVVTLRDLRLQNVRDELQREMKNIGIELEVLSLETIAYKPLDEITPARPIFNPFGRRETDRQAALTALQKQFAEFQPGLLVMISECVDIALEFWLQLPLAARPELRQITRSPWKIDGQSVLSVQVFPGDGTASRYFFYNFVAPSNRRALWIAEEFNALIGEQADEFFTSQKVDSHGIVVDNR